MTPVVGCRQVISVLDGNLKDSLAETGVSNEHVIHGVEYNSWLLDKSSVVDTRDQLSAISFSGLAKVA